MERDVMTKKQRRAEALSPRRHPGRFVLFLIASVLFGLLLGTIIEAVVFRSDAATVSDRQATPSAPTCSAYGSKEFQCQKVSKKSKRAARKIRNGKIKKTPASYDMRDAFSQPKKVRKIMVGRIKAGLAASQGQGTVARGCCSQAHARAIYLQLTNYPVCAATAAENMITEPGALTMCQIEALPPNDEKGEYISAKEVKLAGTVIFCGAVTAAAVGGAVGSGGLATVGAIGTAGGCALELWDQFD